jgi:Chalcone isomerase-like
MRKTILLALAVFLLPCAAFAQTKPPEIARTIHASAPIGSYELHMLLMHIYDASFWSDGGGFARPPYALSVVYAMDFSKGDIIDRTIEELKHVSTLPDAKLQHYATQLANMWPDISEGDRITALTPDAKQTVFYYNGKKTGNIVDADFTTAFFGIWLSPKTSEPEMRDALLGG